MLNRVVSRVYDEMIRPHGIKFSQMNILTVVTLRGPIQPSEVGLVLSLEKSTLSRNVQLMEDNGWIESQSGESGNSHLLRVTRKGRQLLEKAAPDWQSAQEQVCELLGVKTATAIRKTMDRLSKG